MDCIFLFFTTLDMDLVNVLLVLPPFCTLTTHSRKARRHEIHKKNTSKFDPRHRECGHRTWFPTLYLSGTTDSGTGRVVTPWRVMGGMNSILPRRTAYHVTVGCIETPVQGLPHFCRVIYKVVRGSFLSINDVCANITKIQTHTVRYLFYHVYKFQEDLCCNILIKTWFYEKSWNQLIC